MKRQVAWTGAMALALAIAGCSKDETPPPDAMGDGTVKSVATVVSGGNNFRCSGYPRRAGCRPAWPISSRRGRWT